MRLPTSKLHRAFPELDPFTDEQCLAYIRRAKRKHARSRALAVVVTLAVGFPIWCGFGWSFSETINWLFRLDQIGPMGVWLMMLVIAGAFGVPAVIGLHIRDRWLRWMIQNVLEGATCPSCHYSMLGLRIERGAVQSPECGACNVLVEMGLVPEDLIAPHAQ